MKHCDSGRLCFSHQSCFALKSATSFVLHCAQTSSGTPCSSHHQPSWLWPAISFTAAELEAVLLFDLLQAAIEMVAATRTLDVSNCLIIVRYSFSKTNTNPLPQTLTPLGIPLPPQEALLAT